MQRVALVTGASRGLGAVISDVLAGHGYDLILTARGAGELNVRVSELKKYDVQQVRALAGDVADSEHRQRLITAAQQAFGRLDLLVNNASELGPTPLPALADLPLLLFERVLAVNLLAPLALVQAALPLLRASGGLVVNISSDAAVGGYPGWGAYGASKAALDLVSLTLAHELSDSGVGVVSVDPGDMRTAMHQAAYPSQDISDRPLPDVTVPFWAWLLGQDPPAVTGRRYSAQAERWETSSS